MLCNRFHALRAALDLRDQGHLVGGLFAVVVVSLISAGVTSPGLAYAENECFAMLTDTHIGVRPSTTGDLKKALCYFKTRKNLVAVINCGDITDVGGEAEYKSYAEIWRKSRIKASAIYAFGNHDNAAGGYQKWLHRSGYRGYNKTTGVKLFKRYLTGGGP